MNPRASMTTAVGAWEGRRRTGEGGDGAGPTAAGVAGRGVTTVGTDLATGVRSAQAKARAVGNRLVAIGARARWMAWSTDSGTQDRSARTLTGGSAMRLARMACAVGPV